MVSLTNINTIELIENNIAATVSCDKYEGYLYSCIGQQLGGIPNAGKNYLYKTEGNEFETISSELDNYYSTPNVGWFPTPLPSGYDYWTFLNLQAVNLITSNDDGTFKLVCPDCYAQAHPEDGSGNEPLDISFPAEIYMDDDLNVDYDLSTFYVAGTILDTTKKIEDYIGDIKYQILYNLYDKQTAYLESLDTQLRATTAIGIYPLAGLYDFNCIDPYCFVVTYDTNVLENSGSYRYNISVYLEETVSNGAITQPQEKLPDRRYYNPASQKGRLSKVNLTETYYKSVKKPREVKGKTRWTPYN